MIQVFKKSGNLWEKYKVVDVGKPPTPGDYDAAAMRRLVRKACDCVAMCVTGPRCCAEGGMAHEKMGQTTFVEAFLRPDVGVNRRLERIDEMIDWASSHLRPSR